MGPCYSGQLDVVGVCTHKVRQDQDSLKGKETTSTKPKSSTGQNFRISFPLHVYWRGRPFHLPSTLSTLPRHCRYVLSVPFKGPLKYWMKHTSSAQAKFCLSPSAQWQVSGSNFFILCTSPSHKSAGSGVPVPNKSAKSAKSKETPREERVECEWTGKKDTKSVTSQGGCC